MTPTIGRIVIYKLRPGDKGQSTNYAEEAPAVVVRVWGEKYVNLKVITDGPNDIWQTSVHEGAAEGTWHWPERA